MHLALPAEYPIALPPSVTIRAVWLHPAQCSALLSQLWSLWEMQGPGPICYTWLDWLRTSALKHLGIEDSGCIFLEDPTSPISHSSLPGAGQPAASQAADIQAASPASGRGAHGISTFAAAVPNAGFAAVAQRPAPDARLAIAPHPPCTPTFSGGLAHAFSSSIPSDRQRLTPAAAARALLTYATRREAALFQSRSWTCPICFETYVGSRWAGCEIE